MLGFIGVAHAVFVWAGDILFTYAIAGLFLLFFVRTSASRLWKWGIFFITLPGALLWLSAVSVHSSSQSSEEIQQYQIEANEMQSFLSEVASSANEAYATGGCSILAMGLLSGYGVWLPMVDDKHSKK